MRACTCSVPFDGANLRLCLVAILLALLQPGHTKIAHFGHTTMIQKDVTSYTHTLAHVRVQGLSPAKSRCTMLRGGRRGVSDESECAACANVPFLGEVVHARSDALYDL